jgi:hypothetical protein
MPEGHNTCRGVNKLHDHTAVDVSSGICILGVHLLGHDDTAVSDCFFCHAESPEFICYKKRALLYSESLAQPMKNDSQAVNERFFDFP